MKSLRFQRVLVQWVLAFGPAFSLCACSLCVWPSLVWAQEDEDLRGSSEFAVTAVPWPEQLLPTRELPPAPGDYKQWMEQGDVTYAFYDAGKFPRKFQGETRFIANYSTAMKFRWRRVQRGTEPPTLVVRTNFKKIELQIEHKILLPHYLPTDSFYEHPLVRHEFDHVRISSDPRFVELFRKWLRTELQQISVPLNERTDYEELARETVQKRSEEVFERVLQLIQIRYQELDQATKHGQLPLPADFFAVQR